MRTSLEAVSGAGSRRNWRITLPLALVLGAVMLAAGCGKKASAPPPANTSSTPAGPAPQTPVPGQTNPVTPANIDADLGTLQRLNQAVIAYRMQKNSFPTSVEEVATFAGIQVPPPPPGKKYALNARGVIVLMDNPGK